MRKVLDHYGVRYGERTGWQPIRCLNPGGHSHGDRLQSASVNLSAGAYVCFACGIKGDGFAVLLATEGWKVKQVIEFFEMDKLPEESDWLTWR